MKKEDIFKGIVNPQLFWFNIQRLLETLGKVRTSIVRANKFTKEGMFNDPTDALWYSPQKLATLETKLEGIAFACDISTIELIKWVETKRKAVEAYDEEERKDRESKKETNEE